LHETIPIERFTAARKIPRVLFHASPARTLYGINGSNLARARRRGSLAISASSDRAHALSARIHAARALRMARATEALARNADMGTIREHADVPGTRLLEVGELACITM